MSRMGHSRRFRLLDPMSALPRIAAQLRTSSDVPKCANNVLTHRCKIAPLFDHLVSCRQQRGRDRQTERLCRLEIYDEIEARRLGDRKVVGTRALENTSNIVAGLVKLVGETGSVADKATCYD